MRRVLLALAIVLPFFVGCQADLTGPVNPQPVSLQDEINDVLRAEGVDYATYAPLELSIGVRSASADTRAAVDDLVVVRVTDEADRLLFAGSVEDGSIVEGELLVPVEARSMTLTLDSPTVETREIVIDNPYRYAEINRVLIVEKGDYKGESDRDDDGIADHYDAFPDDPELAFTRSIPTTNSLTIAFEDNYPELGDGDYNDFIADYRIVEYRSGKNTLVRLEGTATAVARGAGFQHEFGIVIDFPGLSGDADIIRYDGNGNLIGTTSATFAETARIVLFPETGDAFTRPAGHSGHDNIDPDGEPSLGHTTEFILRYAPTTKVAPIDAWAPYDPYLLVTNPDLDYRPDVHLIGKPPLADTENPDPFKDFRDADGYPRALLVPGDWLWPREQTHIEEAYPEFVAWRESYGSTNTDWFFEPVAAKVVPR